MTLDQSRVQLRVFRSNLLQDGDIGVGVFPKRYEVLVGSLCPGTEPQQRPNLLETNGRMQDLGTLGGSFSNANAINEAGEVVGYASNAGDQAVLALLWRNGVITDLGTVDGDACSTGNAINSKRQVVDILATCDFSVRHAFLCENGSMVDLHGDNTNSSFLLEDRARKLIAHFAGPKVDFGLSILTIVAIQAPFSYWCLRSS